MEAEPASPAVFSGPVKWEQNLLTHSFGTIRVTEKAVEYIPGKVSVLGKVVSIPRHLIDVARKRDNFLWRGAVVLELAKPVQDRSEYTFFLGSAYLEFLEILDR